MSQQPIASEVWIHSKAPLVWNALTDPELMKLWMGEEDLQLELETDWKIGGKFIIRGFHHVRFENTGRILDLVPNKKLVYTHLSSISELDNRPENYCVFDFNLEEKGDSTLLKLSITNFPTETIYKHLELYWRVTLVVIKEFVESRMTN